MKYINLINEFWRMNRIEAFRPLDAMIYLYLLDQCNLRQWQNPFPITSRSIELTFGITNKTAIEVRKRLQMRGLLTFISRRNRPVIMTLTHVKNAIEEESGKNPGKNEGKNSGRYPEGIATDDIRDKRKDTRYLKKHSIECKKSESVSEKSEDYSDNTKSSSQPNDSTSTSPKTEVRSQGNSARYVAFLDWVAEKAPYVAKNLKPLSEPEFDRLIMRFGAECLARNVDNLENRRDLRRRYTSLYRTMLNWCAQDPLAK